jgi:PAS domain S-box-containing protein
LVFLALVGFVLTFLRAGRPWLAAAVCGLRTVSLLLNFAVGPNLNYQEVTNLRRIWFLGESVTVAEGVRNPLMLVGQVSVILFVIFIMDATITVWRRGDRRQALTLGGSIFLFMLFAAFQTVTIFWFNINLPVIISFFFMAIVLMMGWEMSWEPLRAAQLASELHESEARYRSIFDEAIEGMFRISRRGNILLANRALAHMLGYDSPEDLIGNVGNAMNELLVVPDERSRIVWLVKTQGGVHEQELQFKRKDGTRIWVSLSSRPVRAQDGQLEYSEGFIQDITARKYSEQKLAQQRLQLAHFARVSSMGQLASSLAHELSQPLGAILRNAEAGGMLLRNASPDLVELAAILEDICKDDRRAGAVIDRIRMFLRRGETEHSLIDFGALADESLQLVQPDAQKRGIQLVLEPLPALPPVYCDRVQVQQVLLNLIMNAMEAVIDGHRENPRVVVRVKPTETAIETSVSDNGSGIPEDQLEQVFEQFFTTKSGGLGMGLAIAGSIVEAHEGRLWTENNPEGGATFTIALPIPKGDARK